jgi:hypothetical protein
VKPKNLRPLGEVHLSQRDVARLHRILRAVARAERVAVDDARIGELRTNVLLLMRQDGARLWEAVRWYRQVVFRRASPLPDPPRGTAAARRIRLRAQRRNPKWDW